MIATFFDDNETFETTWWVTLYSIHLAGFRSFLDSLSRLFRLSNWYLPAWRFREDEVEEEEGEGRNRGGDLEDLPVRAKHGDEGDDDLADGEGDLGPNSIGSWS